VVINGQTVASTRPKDYAFGTDFNLTLGANLSVYLFTMPEDITVKVKIGSGLRYTEVARIPVEIPGLRVKSLTSAYDIVREISFSQKAWKAAA
jgi:hypothetical protein